MSQVRCRTCGAWYYPTYTDSFRSLNKPDACIPCLWKILVDQSSKELENLKSELAFLRLKSVSEQPDAIQKSDVMIIVQGRTDEPLHAHRFILSSKSCVFRTMFNSKMSEQETGIIHIDDATLPAMRAMINFCYNAKINFTDEVTAEEVLAVAHKYQITLLHQICEKHLIKSLNNNNLAQRLVLAMKFEAPGLEVAATDYFRHNFNAVIAHVKARLR